MNGGSAVGNGVLGLLLAYRGEVVLVGLHGAGRTFTATVSAHFVLMRLFSCKDLKCVGVRVFSSFRCACRYCGGSVEWWCLMSMYDLIEVS